MAVTGMLGNSARARLFKTRKVMTHQACLLVVLAVVVPAPFVDLASELELRVFNLGDWVLHTLLCVEATERFMRPGRLGNAGVL